MNRPVLVFDMDGVLVDVTESYRETIARTVEHFTRREVTRAQIQEFKNQGGWNDDWKLSHHMVAAAGVDVPFEDVKARFQELFRGNGDGGLMLRERWVARPGVLEKLGRDFGLAVFTGRPKDEAEITLRRFAPDLVFDPVIAMEDVENHKPAPEGLLRIREQHGDAKIFYIGDTVDDARCARAAKVPFIGITAPSNPSYLDLVFLFQGEGAYAIVDDINYLEEVFAS
ncbi:MAG TPA: TIGR01548 family HAD-type hydrolase [Bryobacteraceae bacterium]|nr:TIGR01548 family HAD-type hydrolase [Bryobacteraceae bacterium]